MRKRNVCQTVITFHTTAEAIATEKLCRNLGLAGKLISAPRELSADCGIAWAAPVEAGEMILHALENAKIEIAGHHEILL